MNLFVALGITIVIAFLLGFISKALEILLGWDASDALNVLTYGVLGMVILSLLEKTTPSDK